MNGAEMKQIRQRLGMSELQLARAIGYTGTDRNDNTRIREYERDKKQIPLYIARLVWLIDLTIGDRISAGIGWPEWPGYDFDHTPDPLDNLPDNPDQEYTDRALALRGR